LEKEGRIIMNLSERLIVALDVSTAQEALGIADSLGDTVSYFKVGMQLYNSEGPEMVKQLTGRGKQVFLDLKFHDIPNTAAQAGGVVTRLGVTMFNLHVAGGRVMMKETLAKAADEAAKLGINRPKIIGVTVLTSMNQQQFEADMGYLMPVKDKVREWSLMAQEAGLDGVVASAEELPIIRASCGNEFLVVTPGIRPAWSVTNDQQRIVTPKEAIKMGASYIVVGRPIYGNDNPREAALKILAEMEEGLSC
jgi:orotidine-5'-phosphate decarboxylase